MQNSRHDHANLINSIDKLISDNLSEPMLVRQLSDRVGLSKFHLHRIFAAQTGFELSEYMQRRKMERALTLLTQDNSSVIDVALAVGYDSHSSFSRVFKQSFGVTPSQVKQGVEPEPLVKYKKKNKFEFEQIETKWLYLPETKVLGKYCKGFEHSSFAVIANKKYQELTELSARKDYLQSEPVGVALTNPWSNKAEEAEFFCGFLSGLEQCDQELEQYIWPEGNYICSTYTGPYQQMWQHISRLHSLWVEQNNIKLATRQVVQRYLNHPAFTAPENLQTELYFLVKAIE